MAEKIIQTAGRNQLGEFAPTFAHLNDDVLFGEVKNMVEINRIYRRVGYCCIFCCCKQL